MIKLLILSGLILVINSSAMAQLDSLQTFRKQIDTLDMQVIRLLGKRMEVVTEIGSYKAVHKIPVMQSKRFEEILQKNISLGQEVQLSEAFIRALMNAIHNESLAKEKVLQKNSK